MKSARTRPAERGGKPPAYHHGDLRAALLEAAEVELAEKGVQGFTLRSCARRAVVSHAAPAHHFADVTALLTEMAAIGFERLTRTMRERRAMAAADPRSQFVASGEGYIAFALANPQHFALMFGRAELDRANTRFAAAGKAAFGELLDVIAGLTGTADPASDAEATSCWPGHSCTASPISASKAASPTSRLHQRTPPPCSTASPQPLS